MVVVKSRRKKEAIEMGKLSRKLKRAKLDKKDRKNAAVGGSSMAIMGAAVGLVGGPLAPFTVPACALVSQLTSTTTELSKCQMEVLQKNSY